MQYQPFHFLLKRRLKLGLGEIQRSAVFKVTFDCTEAELKLTHMA